MPTSNPTSISPNPTRARLPQSPPLRGGRLPHHLKAPPDSSNTPAPRPPAPPQTHPAAPPRRLRATPPPPTPPPPRATHHTPPTPPPMKFLVNVSACARAWGESNTSATTATTYGIAGSIKLPST